MSIARMFTVDREHGALCVQCCNTHIQLTPEDPAELGILQQTPDRGRIDGTSSNGRFCVTWDDHVVQIIVGKYGDGRGGSVVVGINRADDTDDSFAHALAEWQAHTAESVDT